MVRPHPRTGGSMSIDIFSFLIGAAFLFVVLDAWDRVK